MIVVASDRWSFLRGFNNNCSDLTGVVLVFWVDGGLWEIYGHLQEVVALGSLTVFTENIS